MNAKAITILLVFLGWSVISWKWYLCRIKEKCDDEPKTALIQASDTISSESSIKVDSNSNNIQKSVIELDKRTILHFQSKSINLEEDSILKNYLKQLTLKLIKSRDSTITIVGHANEKGFNDSANSALSLQNAKYIQTFMVSNGVPIQKIKIEGRGANEPLRLDTTLESIHKNFRVEILFNK